MFAKHRVGISIAITRHFFEAGFWFQPSPTEDFNFLERISRANTTMVISPYITYYVMETRLASSSVEYPR